MRRELPLLGLALGIWALLPPYTGPALNTETRVEVADHVVPAVVMLAASLAALAVTRRGERRSGAVLGAGVVVLLAGIWMTATHVPLVGQAARGEAGVTWGAAVYHTAPGLAVLALGLVWTARAWGQVPASGDPARPVGGRRR